MTNPWFRFYSETLHDRKLERIARVTGNDKVTLLGVWITLLSLANDSPERGVLLLVDSIPLTFDDFCYETEMEADVLTPIIEKFMKFEMLSCDDGIYYITNWGKRQFKSDTSKERVQRYRDRKAQENEEQCNVTVALLQQPCNAPDTDTDTEQITEEINELLPNLKTGIEHGETPVPPIPAYTDLRKTWIELFKNKPAPRENNKTLTAKVKTRMKSQDFYDNWSGAMYRASKHSGLINASWFDLAWFVNNDDNYEKVLNGKYDWMDKDAGENSPIQLF